jgi:hypothetical protein
MTSGSIFPERISMLLTTAQQQTLAAAIRAETDAGVVAALGIRNDVSLTDWCNSASAQEAWNPALTGKMAFEAIDVAKFDNLTSGKRDAWRMMLDFAPLDMARNKLRKAVLDVWGATDSVAVLQACVRKATNGEKYLGGTAATENTVTAWKLNVAGALEINDVSDALNRY